MRIAALLAVLALPGCGATEGDLFYLRNEGATMPVWVRGNVDSGTFLFIVHGGPGGSAFIYPGKPAFDAIEADVAVVYWEQRGAGSSQGGAAPETLTLDQYVADMALAVDLLRERHDVERLYVLGHSWGGALAPAYLLDPERQAEVDGLLIVDGMYDFVDGLPLTREWLANACTEKRPEDPERWDACLAWIEANPVIEHEDIHDLVGWVHAAGGYEHGEIERDAPPWARRLPEEANANVMHVNQRYSIDTFDFTGIDLSDELADITIPAAVLWGRHDGITPIGLAEPAYTQLGAAEADKSLTIFEQAGHSPYLEEPEKFADTVLAFVEAR